MLVDFNSLPDDSRVWIYQCNRSFNSIESELITSKVIDFISNWEAHGKPLSAGYDFPYNRFIILAVDQSINEASGCSIDSSVRFIQSLEKEFDVDLMDKMNVSFKQGEFVAHKSLTEFRKMVKQKAVSKNTIVFNNLVTNIHEYKTNWEVPAKDSWHNRFIK